MSEHQLVPAALKQTGYVRDSAIISANYNKLSDNIRRLAPHGLQCTIFCGGTQCKYENPDNWTSNVYVIQGIFSNWITDDILAMARPSTSIIIKKNVIQQFHSWGIKSIINLQMPNEHASCGPPLEASGFTYDPAIFMENNIYYYNFAWKDYGDATLQGLLNMVKVLAFAVKEGRVAIHCHAGLGRTGVLIACYLVYILRVRANDAINYVRLKRPGSVQTRGQILSVQEFAQHILPQSIIYNIKNNQKEKKGQDLSLPKCLKNQRILLHGYEERSLKYLPKVVYYICQRILILCKCWCEEFTITNVPFTNNFLVTKINFENRRTSSTTIHTDTGSQQTLSDGSVKSVNLTSATGSTSYSSIANLSSCNSFDNDHNVNIRVTTTTTTLSDYDESLNPNDELIVEDLCDNKCFQLLTQLECENMAEILKPYTVDEITNALLTDYTTLDDSTKKYIKQFQINFNCTQTAWSQLKTERNLLVLSALLYEWLENLRYPILKREDLSNIVIYGKRPENCLQKFNIENQYILEFIIRFLTHLQPCQKTTIIQLLKRFAAAFTHKTVALKNIRMPADKGFQKLRDGTLEYVVNFFYSLYNIFDENRQSSGFSLKLYETHSGSSEIQSNSETDDDFDVECPNHC